MQWGRNYCEFHDRAWAEAVRVLKPGGLFMLNIKDHIRGGRRQRVTLWHALNLVGRHGVRVVECRRVGVAWVEVWAEWKAAGWV